MSHRAAALLLTGDPWSPAAPAGVDPAALAAAMAEDVLTVCTELRDVDEVIVAVPVTAALASSIAWPGTVLLRVYPDAGAHDVLVLLAQRGYREAALVAADAPDLPALHLAKTFSAHRSAGRSGGGRRRRRPADLARLDSELEGWDTTRALLAGG